MSPYYKLTIVDTVGGTCAVYTTRDAAKDALAIFEHERVTTEILTIRGKQNEARRGEIEIAFRMEHIAGILMEEM